MGRRVVTVQLGVGGSQQNLAARRHGVDRIDDEIHQYLFDLRWVSAHDAKRMVQHGLHGDAGPGHAAKHRLHPPNDFINIERLGQQGIATTDRQQLSGQRAGALGRRMDLGQFLAVRT